jgi:hypothetical protein
MARRYKRDSRGRFAGGGGGGSKSKKPRKSDIAFQKSGKGGGTSVKAGRAAKAAYKAKEGQRRLTNLSKRDAGSKRYSGGSQQRKKSTAKRAAQNTGYQRTRSANKPVSPAVKAQRKAAAQAKRDARINQELKARREFAAKTTPKKRRRAKK